MGGGYRHLEAITEVGGFAWSRTKQQVVDIIDGKDGHFYTEDQATGQRTPVITVSPGQGRAKYLMSYPDGNPGNNLLNLNACSVSAPFG